jgi:uncharacterized protein (DUF952 family)
MNTIFHIAERSAWDLAQETGEYVVPSLEGEGFIHLSTKDQYPLTANRYYRGRTDLVLLEVDEAALVDLRYEASTNNELFPHLYGPLPVSAVVCVHMFEPEVNGEFPTYDFAWTACQACSKRA